MLLPFLSQAGAAAANSAGIASGTAANADTEQANRLTEMTRLLSGDLSGSLTGGDKLLALSGLLRSATRSGRRAGLTPEQVIGNLRQQKLAELQNRMAVEQLRVQMAQTQTLNTAWADYLATQPEERRAKLAGIVDPKERQKLLSEQPKPFQLTKADGKQYMVFANPDGTTTTKDLGLPQDVEGDWKDYDYNGDGLTESVFVDKRTGKPILNDNQQALVVQIGQTPAQKDASARGWAAVGISRERLKMDRANGGGGGGGSGGDGKTRTVVYRAPGKSAPQVGRGQVLSGGFVRVLDGPYAGQVMPQAKAASSASDTGGI